MSQPSAVLDRFEANLALVHNLFDDVTEERLKEERVPGKWSAHANLAHLGQFHDAMRERVGWILSQDDPKFTRFNPDTHPDTAVWTAKSKAQLLQDFEAERRKLLAELRALPPEAWQRIGTHGVFGTKTLAGWLEFWLQHEGHHLYTALVRAKT
ncbi:DinB family protein [Deinococcus yavapaiensis]|uniref:DinB family protein n=1 Tax=Deinococcus yavapaiensis KR-236 TaxID=694435 RepID=A0A318SAE4_9DEIO|nr:DinB family protein [Deinococcus yavapaiensis]PYE55180.1 DinB family protein [Deinococcus yavapaiensis KR-236]